MQDLFELLLKSLVLDIANKLEEDWKPLGRKLEIFESELNAIDADYKLEKEKAFQMLSKWKNKNGRDATTEKLVHALINIHRLDLAEQLRMPQGNGRQMRYRSATQLFSFKKSAL